ncbi:MAG: zf-HC2 domain-containing protein [Phycisphaerae bacterium]|nr:zf-HC2 domain-containing protein [Phycisphaerae bacterium]
MRENEKNEMEELLSAYVDDALSDRQRTEVRRLVANNAAVAAQLRFLEKQKQLLNALPTVPAPAGLPQRVRAAVAQKAVQPEEPVVPAVAMVPVSKAAVSTPVPAATLSKAAVSKAPVSAAVPAAALSKVAVSATAVRNVRNEGERQLFVRRILTAAAMVFIPVAVLAFVVWSIVEPLSGPGKATVSSSVQEPAEAIAPATAVSFPLSASLYLTTSQPTAMDSFIYKAIYKHDLTNHATTIGLAARERTYQIRANRSSIVGLLGELATVWDRCESTAMTVHGRSMAVNARIENVRADQAMALYEGDVFSNPVQLARQMAEMNRLMRHVPDYDVRVPVMPELTSGYRKPAAPAQPDAPQAYVTLFINIRSR